MSVVEHPIILLHIAWKECIIDYEINTKLHFPHIALLIATQALFHLGFYFVKGHILTNLSFLL